MGNLKIRDNIIILDCNLELVNNTIVANDFVIKGTKSSYRLNTDRVFKDTYKLGELFDNAIGIRFKQRQLEIKKKYFSNTSTLKQDVINQMSMLMNNDLPKKTLSSYIPLYSSIYNKLNDKSLVSPDEMADFVISTDAEAIANSYFNLITSINNNDIDVSTFVEPLTKLIVLSNGTYSDIQINVILTDEITSATKDYFKQYGMPFWTDREHLTEMPIDNFIKICILIYRFKKLWDAIVDFDKLEENIENFKDMYYQLDMAKDLKRLYADNITRNHALDIFLQNIVTTDADIRYNFNYIDNIQLINYRIWNKPQENSMHLLNETEYESLILAVWDYFYINYITNSKGNICSKCGKLIKDKAHNLRGTDKGTILCDTCYKTKRTEDVNNNVKNCRNKKQN